MLLDSVRRYFRENRPPDTRWARFGEGQRQPPDAWREMAELGWLALAVPERLGGLEADWDTRLAVLREAGADGRPEPLDVHLMLSDLLLRCLPQGQEEATAAAIMAGDMRVGVVELRPRAGPTGGNALGGESGPVYGAGASHLLVLVHAPGRGCRLAWTAVEGPGLSLQQGRFLDGRGCLTVRFNHCEPRWLDASGHHVRDLMAAGLVADCTGALDGAFRQTLDYLKQRRQFGRPLSDFQVVQHGMAEVFCDLQQAVALTRRLAREMNAAQGSACDSLPAAKAFLSRRLLRGLGRLIQLSGGIGMTEEYPLAHYYKRAQTGAALFGDRGEQLGRISPVATLLGSSGCG